MRCIAIIAVRNARQYVEGCLDWLRSQGVEAAIIDHTSTDGSFEMCRDRVGYGVCALEQLPFDGEFRLRAQLEMKHRVSATLDADWVIHQDIDERLQSPAPGETLQEAIVRAGRSGANCINFDEFVFLPYPDEVGPGEFFQGRRYYYFQPSRPRLMRAWRRGSGLDNRPSGGHMLAGNIRLFPEEMILRHYIFTSQDHAFEKYSERRFAAAEVQEGWHSNRLAIPRERLRFPPKTRLKLLPAAESVVFDRSEPWTRHYWEEEEAVPGR